MKKTVLSTLIVILVVGVITFLFVLYGRGYRFNFSGNGDQIIAGTGLLVMTSTPNGAKVYINDELSTATDDTVNLAPGEYDLRIEKDGYYPWRKKVVLKNEAVTKTDAVLFPIAPKLESATLLGAVNPQIDPSGALISYQVSSSSAENNGIYILNLGNRFNLPFGNLSRQITTDDIDSFSQAKLEFSPNGSQLLATVEAAGVNRIYLLRTDAFNPTPQDVTVNIEDIRAEWATQQTQLENKLLASMPAATRAFIKANFSHMKLSPEGDKVMYTASESATMPFFIKPSLPSTNSTPETRTIVKGNAYVYQIKEDKNYLLMQPENGLLPTFVWHPSSAHVVFEQNKRIFSMEYDGGNKTTLYSGPFETGFLYTWPDGSGLIILTNFNDETVPPNLYKIGLR